MHFPESFLINPVIFVLQVRQLVASRQDEQEISQGAQNFEEAL